MLYMLFSCRTQQDSKTLNIVTGFQIMDGEKHIFVLEGLRDEAIQMLWETLPRAKKQGRNTTCDILLNEKTTCFSIIPCFGPIICTCLFSQT